MKTQVNNISFALRNIKTEQFATFDDILCEGGQIRLGTNVKFGMDEKKRMMAVMLAFHFECNEKPFIKLEVSCHFEIKEEDWIQLINEPGNLITVPKGFAQHLGVITVGTARGILHAKTEGTDFNNYFLPTINLTEIIKDNQSFSLDKSDNIEQNQ